MSPSIRDLTISVNSTVRTALLQIDRLGSGLLAVVSRENRLVGVVTDGDIRRHLLAGMPLDGPLRAATNTSCINLPISATDREINQALAKVTFIPLIDEQQRLVDYADRRRHRRFPVADSAFNGNELKYLEECVRTGWISSQGQFVTKFEDMFSELHGGAHALTVSNGTVALHLAMVSLDIGAGDEVILPDFTFGATANAVIHAGATPVLVDVDHLNWTLDPERVAAAVTPRTKAIIPVHIYGHACDMDALMAIAKKHNLKVIEDCAESLGGRHHGSLLGTFGDAACFSFFANKTVTTGEGGMILFRDPKTSERARMLRDHGMRPTRRYWHEEPGYNYRLTNLQAAVGVAQLERLPEILERKRNVFELYRRALAATTGISSQQAGTASEPACWLYTILVAPGTLSRDELSQRLLRRGVDTRPVFPALHKMPAFSRATRAESYPVTEFIAEHGLSLPSYPQLTESDIAYISDTVATILEVRKLVTNPHTTPRKLHTNSEPDRETEKH